MCRECVIPRDDEEINCTSGSRQQVTLQKTFFLYSFLFSVIHSQSMRCSQSIRNTVLPDVPVPNYDATFSASNKLRVHLEGH